MLSKRVLLCHLLPRPFKLLSVCEKVKLIKRAINLNFPKHLSDSFKTNDSSSTIASENIKHQKIFKKNAIIGDLEIRWETGKIAKRADGSCVASIGDTQVLVTVTCSKAPSPYSGHIPLQVDYREKFTAVKRIPRTFTRREGAPRDREVLIARLIDRALRPGFPQGFLHETFVMASVLSADGSQDPDIVAINAASAALLCSDIPWSRPIGALRLGIIDDDFIINPSLREIENSSLNLTCAGNQEGFVLLDCQAKEVPESVLMKGLHLIHSKFKSIVDSQLELARQVNKSKRTANVARVGPAASEKIFPVANFLANKYLSSPSDSKQERSAIRSQAKRKLIKYFEKKQLLSQSESNKDELKVDLQDLEFCLEMAEKGLYRKMALKEGLRMDGRGLTELRPLSSEVEVLPIVHGSSLFQRGETQSLCIVTVGNDRDVQKLDDLLGEQEKNLIVHYSFPPCATNEPIKLGTITRREIGHGNLIERSLIGVMPRVEQFPFPVRLTSETLESNGSSSMAAVCGGSLALKDAGIPIKELVAGVSIGLFSNLSSSETIIAGQLENQDSGKFQFEEFVLLTDVQGLEDHFGDMDFKIAGTANGITATQLGIKVPYLPLHIISMAFDRARHAIRQILYTMKETMASRSSNQFPEFGTAEIHKDLLGNVIGEDGERIMGIEEQSGCRLIVREDTHEIYIYGPTNEQYRQAENAILDVQGTNIHEGEVYKVRVVRVMDFGAFVELPSGFQTLLHISEVAHERIKSLEEILSEGMELEVKCLGRDHRGNLKMSRKALLPKT